MTQYQRGAAFERRVMVDLGKRGYYPIRSAGSHSAVDVLALKEYGMPLAVQAKLDGRVDPAEWDELWDLRTRAVILIASVGPKRGQIAYRRITGPKNGGHRGVPCPAEPFEP